MAKVLTEHAKLLIEAHKISYRLRSTFFFRKLQEYGTLGLPKAIAGLLPFEARYDWTKYNHWGISDDAFNYIAASSLSKLQVFAHPKVLREQPALTSYYRNVAVLSQKSVQYLCSVNSKPFEEKTKTSLSDTQALALSRLFNEHISLIIESTLGKLNESEVNGLLLASTGAQIDGSWRNSIGGEAENVVQAMIIQEAVNRKALHSFISRKDGSIIPASIKVIEAAIKDVSSVKGVMLFNLKSILFSSEPDLTLVDKDGVSELVIEVKGGTDPAGALERYGAAKKSFEHSILENEHVTTCILASCITNEVETRMKNDKSISAYFNLTKVITDDDYKAEVMEYLFGIILS